MNRIPFNYGLFYNAMVGLIGREPEDSHRYGSSGYYEFRYYPKTEKEGSKTSPDGLNYKGGILAEWLDNFELVFSKTTCNFGIHDYEAGIESTGKPFLLIRISHKPTKED